MTQLYVGNLSADGDEKAIRALFSNYGVVREVLMKNGYAFVEFEDARSADTAMRDLNGSDILGHPMIVEPSHQQRLSSRRKPMCGRVEVVSIPPPMTLQQIEHLLTQFGPVLKMEIEESRIFNIVYCRSPSFITFNIQIIVITGGCCLLLSSRLKGLHMLSFSCFRR
jgi:RNA recognition motif-containing protein